MRDGDALQNNPQVSRRALEELHEQLFGWCLTRCDFVQAAAEDLLQQTYVEVLGGKARYEGKSTLRTFLFAVAQNIARSRLRRSAVRLRLLRSYAAGIAAAEPPPEPAGADERVWQAVMELPARQRDMTELVFCRDLSISEACQIMGVTVGTGRVHYERAKKALAVKLAGLRD